MTILPPILSPILPPIDDQQYYLQILHSNITSNITFKTWEAIPCLIPLQCYLQWPAMLPVILPPMLPPVKPRMLPPIQPPTLATILSHVLLSPVLPLILPPMNSFYVCEVRLQEPLVLPSLRPATRPGSVQNLSWAATWTWNKLCLSNRRNFCVRRIKWPFKGGSAVYFLLFHAFVWYVCMCGV